MTTLDTGSIHPQRTNMTRMLYIEYQKLKHVYMKMVVSSIYLRY